MQKNRQNVAKRSVGKKNTSVEEWLLVPMKYHVAMKKYKTLPDEQKSKDKTSEWTVKIIIKLVQLWWSLFDFSWKLLLHEEVGESGDEADDDYLEK